jgi:hypothetical protein
LQRYTSDDELDSREKSSKEKVLDPDTDSEDEGNSEESSNLTQKRSR